MSQPSNAKRQRYGALTGVLVALAASACDEPKPTPTPIAESAPVAAASATPAATTKPREPMADEAPFTGDAEHGRALVARFECQRCHEGTGVAPASAERRCVGCHEDILAGRFSAPSAVVARWREHLGMMRATPSLSAMGARFRPAWIASFLLAPHDLRPGLPASMPRLPITSDEARDVAAYLTRDPMSHPAFDAASGDVTRGRALFEAKACGACHAFTGAGVASSAPVEGAAASGPAELAPDLRFARERLRPEAVVAWLRDPAALKPGTPMPRIPLEPDEARDLAAFVLRSELAAVPVKPMPERLPVLERRVSFDEVYERVLRRTCRHCHAEADKALGDGGPGNTGGFGFKPRGLALERYEAVAAGYVDDHGVRQSVFSPMPDGTPRLVAVLRARQAEEAGHPDPALRGMPLGFPALTPEELQLVESWVAQGRPQ
jgi:cytochrome c2